MRRYIQGCKELEEYFKQHKIDWSGNSIFCHYYQEENGHWSATSNKSDYHGSIADRVVSFEEYFKPNDILVCFKGSKRLSDHLKGIKTTWNGANIDMYYYIREDGKWVGASVKPTNRVIVEFDEHFKTTGMKICIQGGPELVEYFKRHPATNMVEGYNTLLYYYQLENNIWTSESHIPTGYTVGTVADLELVFINEYCLIRPYPGRNLGDVVGQKEGVSGWFWVKDGESLSLSVKPDVQREFFLKSLKPGDHFRWDKQVFRVVRLDGFRVVSVEINDNVKERNIFSYNSVVSNSIFPLTLEEVEASSKITIAHYNMETEKGVIKFGCATTNIQSLDNLSASMKALFHSGNVKVKGIILDDSGNTITVDSETIQKVLKKARNAVSK